MTTMSGENDMMNFTRRNLGQTVAGIATAVALTFGASAAHATAVTWIDLDAANGGPLDLAGPDALNGYITGVDGGVSISDSGIGTTPVWGAGDKFKFNYDFTVSTASSATGNIVESPTGGISHFAIKLIDLTTHTFVASGVAGSGPSAGQLVISAANLVANNTYDLIVTGSLSPHAHGTAGFNGDVSAVAAVPLPGALTLFGSGLLGLAGFARRRRAKGIAALSVAIVALPVAMTAGAGSAQASEIVETSTIGVLPVASSTTKIQLNGKVNGSGGISGDSYYTPGGGNASTNPSVASTGSGVAPLVFDYDFTVAKPQKISLNLSTLNQSLTTSDFTLVDLTTNKTVGSTLSGNFLTITDVLHTGNAYQFVVDLPTIVKGSSVSGVGTVSAVPVPGALVLFGSGLIGLASFGRRNRRKTLGA
jgi:hypothetical protein